MKSKINRLSIIKEIIEKEPVSSQEELLLLLKKEGFDLTQATLSRDLKQLKISKVPDAESGYVYRTASSMEATRSKLPIGNMFSDYFKSIEFSNNIAVIRTFSGYANSIAISIDSQNLFEIIGTIAGDDTILLVLREGVSSKQLKLALSKKFPALEAKM